MKPEELKKRRERLGMTQQRLADLLGVNQMTVSRWERDERSIPPYLHLALRTIESDSGRRDDREDFVERFISGASIPASVTRKARRKKG